MGAVITGGAAAELQTGIYELFTIEQVELVRANQFVCI